MRSPFTTRTVIEQPSEKLEPQMTLVRIKLYLDKAEESTDSAIFLALCHEGVAAKEKFKQELLTRYADLFALLDQRNHVEKAGVFREKWKKMGGGNLHESDLSSSHIASRAPTPNPCVPHATPGSETPAVNSSAPSEREVHVTLPRNIFPSDARRPALDFKPPELGARLNNTPQLAYCLGLLQAGYEPGDILDPNTRNWLQITKDEPDEKERLVVLAKNVIRAFMNDEFKDSKAVAEVVHLAPVLEHDDFRYLVNELYTGIDQSGLLHVHQLEGLAHLVQGARPGYLEGDDFVQILDRLATRLRNAHQLSTGVLYQLTLAISHVLDAMAAARVRGLSRERIHQPLSSYLNGLKTSSDPYLVYQAAYAYQALRYVPDDETPQQKAFRRIGKTIEGVSELAGAVKDLDYKKLVSGLVCIREGLAVDEIRRALRHTSAEVSSLMESGQGFREFLEDEFSFTNKRAWYPALRGADALIRAGKFTQFRKLVCKAPFRRDTAFQWGVCERLGEIAANPKWSYDIRNGAILFLGEIYRNDDDWGRQATIKQWILHILVQLSTRLGVAKTLLQELGRSEDNMKRQLYQKCYENAGSGIHQLKVVLPAIGSPSLLDRVQEKPDVEGQIRRLRKQRLKDRGNDIYIEPQAKANMQARDKIRFPLMDKVKDFLGDDQKVFLLLGEAGSGKSTFTRELERQLWVSYKEGGAVPLLINLPAIDKPEHDMVAKQLRRIDFTEPQIRELKLHRKFILICDGYDESQKTRNLYTSNRLNQSDGWDAKIVISCRSEYIGTDYRDRFQSGDSNRRQEPESFQEAVITPFSMDQIHEYITQYVSTRRPLWKVDEYKMALDHIPSLKELVRNPFLMSLSLEVLPRLVNPGQDLSATHITRASLYDQFIEHWFERGKKRLGEKKMGPLAKAAFESLVDEGFTRNGIDYLKKLSSAIYKEQDGHSVVRYSRYKDHGTWKAEFFCREEEKQLLREACPLVRNGNQHRFIHRTLLEYGVSLAVFDPQDWKEQTVPDSVLSRRGSADSILSLDEHDDNEKEISGVMKWEPDLNSPLAWRSFTREPSVLQFLEERVHQEPSFKQQLLAYIERSKNDKKWRTAASNAITILVRSGMQFNGEDLRGIQIPKADLRNGMFDSAQLQGADLKGVDLRGVWLKNADLSNADMRGVLLGDLIYLEHKDTVERCLYSPCGRSIALVLNNKEIRLHSTSPWNELCAPDGFSGEDESIAYSPCGCRLAFGGEDNTIRIWHIDSKSLEHTLHGHDFKVTSVAYSPDGYQIASASLDATVKLWNAKTGEGLRTLHGHKFLIHCVAFSPDGSQLASCSDGGTVRLWDVKTGECTHVLDNGHKEPVMKVSYSPQGDRLVSFDRDTVRLWNVQSGDRRPTSTVLSWNHYMFRVFAYSPKGDQVASSLSHEIVLWSTETGTHRVLQGHNYKCKVSALAYSPQGDLIASASSDATVRLWDAETGDSLRVLDGHWREVMSIAFSPTGDRIVTGSLDKTIRLWDVGIRTPRRHGGKSTQVDCSSRGDQVVSGSLDTTPRVWDVGGRASRRASSGHNGKVTQVKCSPNGDQVASCGADTTVRLWDVKTGACLHVLRGHSKPVYCIAYSTKGDQIATGSLDNTARLWDVVTGNCVSTLRHEGHVNGIAYSPQGHQLASCSSDGTVRLWDVSTGECLRILIGHTEGLCDIAYSSQNGHLATSSHDTVLLWDAETGERKHTLSGQHQTMLNIVYSPQGDQIASYGRGRDVGLWSVMTGKRLHTLTYEDDNDRKDQMSSIGCIHKNDVGQVHSVTYSGDADQVVTGYKDGTIRMWDTKTGALLRTLSAHSEMVNRTVYSPQGDLIVSAGDDKSVRLWDAASGQPRAVIQDFQDWVGAVAWVTTQHTDYLVAGCEDGVVGMWQVTVDKGHCQVRLHWRTTSGELHMKGAVVQSVQGLRPLNEKILRQCGAIGKPESFLRGTSKRVGVMASAVSTLREASTKSEATLGASVGESVRRVKGRSEESFALSTIVIGEQPAQSDEDGSEENRGLPAIVSVEQSVQHVEQAKDQWSRTKRRQRTLVVDPLSSRLKDSKRKIPS
ncbi:MAG: WD40-repeat-containing domain protein [Benniella sp.]|nr:MAG: WD40-repeat-containing domain protein [Benniella sp.]